MWHYLPLLILSWQINLSATIKDIEFFIDNKLRISFSTGSEELSPVTSILRAAPGERVRLPCEHDGRHLMRWSWIKKDPLNHTHFNHIISGGIFKPYKGNVINTVVNKTIEQEHRIKVELNNTAAHLVIDEVGEDDEGDYICQVTSLEMNERRISERSSSRPPDLDVNGVACSTACDYYEGTRYAWCWRGGYWDKDWHYCSVDTHHTRYGVDCNNACDNDGTDYFWCYKVGGGWDYCSPQFVGGQAAVVTHAVVTISLQNITFSLHVIKTRQENINYNENRVENANETVSMKVNIDPTAGKDSATTWWAVAVLVATVAILVVLVLAKLTSRKANKDQNVETISHKYKLDQVDHRQSSDEVVLEVSEDEEDGNNENSVDVSYELRDSDDEVINSQSPVDVTYEVRDNDDKVGNNQKPVDFAFEVKGNDNDVGNNQLSGNENEVDYPGTSV